MVGNEKQILKILHGFKNLILFFFIDSFIDTRFVLHHRVFFLFLQLFDNWRDFEISELDNISVACCYDYSTISSSCELSIKVSNLLVIQEEFNIFVCLNHNL